MRFLKTGPLRRVPAIRSHRKKSLGSIGRSTSPRTSRVSGRDDRALHDVDKIVVFMLPFPLLHSLQLNKRQIWGLIATFSLGLITISMSVLRFATIEVIQAWTNVCTLILYAYFTKYPLTDSQMCSQWQRWPSLSWSSLSLQCGAFSAAVAYFPPTRTPARLHTSVPNTVFVHHCQARTMALYALLLESSTTSECKQRTTLAVRWSSITCRERMSSTRHAGLVCSTQSRWTTG